MPTFISGCLSFNRYRNLYQLNLPLDYSMFSGLFEPKNVSQGDVGLGGLVVLISLLDLKKEVELSITNRMSPI